MKELVVGVVEDGTDTAVGAGNELVQGDALRRAV